MKVRVIHIVLSLLYESVRRLRKAIGLFLLKTLRYYYFFTFLCGNYIIIVLGIIFF